MPGSQLVQSVVRAAELLQLVGQSERGLGLGELAEALGVTPSAAHNLARTLVAQRLLEKRSRPVRYLLGPAIYELATAQLRRGAVREAELAVKSLAAAHPEATVTYCELQGDEIVVRRRMSPARPGVVERPVGRQMALYTSATGLVYLAFLGSEERAALIARHPFSEQGAARWAGEPALERALAQVREYGVAAPVVAGDTVPVACPVFGPGSELWGTLGLSSNNGQRDPTVELYRRDLQAAAARLAAAMSPSERSEG